MVKSLILPDDPRHGSNAGYVAGCRCASCAMGRLRYQKAHRLRVLSGQQIRYSLAEVLEVVEPWRRMGLSDCAIKEAAGINHGHGFRTAVNSASYRALAAITDEDFAPKATVWSDLTKRRVYSLMAAGHQVRDIPITTCGVWRKTDRVRVDTARAVRDFYAANEFKLGGSRITATKALNGGHVPPLAWDDPGTLAWPAGRPERIVLGPLRPRKTDVDEMVVERAMSRDFDHDHTHAERVEITRRWESLGRSLYELEHLTGWKSERYTTREDGAA